MAEVVGSVPADEPGRFLRCTLRLDPDPELRLDGGREPEAAGGPAAAGSLALPGTDDLAALAAAGIACSRDGDAIVLRFPPAPAS